MKLIKSPSVLTNIALVITIFFWASAFVGIRAGLKGYTPGSLALFRYLVASFFMIFLYLRLPKKSTPTWQEIPQLILIGFLGFTLYNVALNYGEISVPSGIASFIISLVPVFITSFAVLFLHERLSGWSWFGVMISVVGILIIACGEMEGAKFDYGVLYCLLATLCMACYVVLQKPLLRKYSAIELTAYAIWSGTALMLFYLPELIQQLPRAPITATLAIVYMGIFPAAVAYIAWSYALAQVPASRAASYMYTIPLVATLLGWLVLGEIPALVSLIGGVISLIGAVIVNQRR